MTTDWQLIQAWAGVSPDGIPGPATASAIIGKAGIERPVVKRRLYDPGVFFMESRAVTGGRDQEQVDSMNLLLDAASHWSTGWVAYALATAWHECRLRPIKERGGSIYFNTRYGPHTRVGKVLGNTEKGDGARYAGRGFVQLTGRTNYKNAGKFLGLDLLRDPDLALVPANAAKILIWGMEGGKFTGKALRHYLNGQVGTLYQFTQARRIINGSDKQDLIAGYAAVFQSALIKGRWQ